MATNTKYKASLFSTLFSEPDILRELYCALEDVTLPPDTPIVINNEGIVKRCKTLSWYSAFVAKVREYEREGLGLEEAIRKGIQYCIEHDILKDFLKEHATEVVNMLYAEWDMDEALAVRYEEGLEKGLEKAARNALAKGSSLEYVQDITGFDMETIKRLVSERTHN